MEKEIELLGFIDMHPTLTEYFLDSKLSYYEHSEYGTVCNKSSDGNINSISENIISFDEYNLLPGLDGQLDGHYTFYVNIHNFKYLIYKSSDYGGFTWTAESKNTDWITDLNDRELSKVESIIAFKILYKMLYKKKNSCIRWSLKYKDLEAIEKINLYKL